MERVFECWMGQPVVVQLALGQLKLRLRGQVLREDEETLFMRPECGPDLKIAKTTVLAIEEMDVRFYHCRDWRPKKVCPLKRQSFLPP
jgi:hypothetical protein